MFAKKPHQIHKLSLVFHSPKDSNESGHHLSSTASLWTFVKESKALDRIMLFRSPLALPNITQFCLVISVYLVYSEDPKRFSPINVL